MVKDGSWPRDVTKLPDDINKKRAGEHLTEAEKAMLRNRCAALQSRLDKKSEVVSLKAENMALKR